MGEDFWSRLEERSSILVWASPEMLLRLFDHAEHTMTLRKVEGTDMMALYCADCEHDVLSFWNSPDNLARR